MKQIIIMITIIFSIVCLDRITISNTKNSVQTLNNELDSLNITVEEENTEKMNTSLEEVDKYWQNFKKTLSLYIEHDELEKVETELVSLKANIKTKEYETAIESIGRAKFILEHIQEKNELKLKNIV